MINLNYKLTSKTTRIKRGSKIHSNVISKENIIKELNTLQNIFKFFLFFNCTKICFTLEKKNITAYLSTFLDKKIE